MDKNISGEFLFFSGEKKMKEIEESSVGNVIFSLLLFLFMSKENMFFYYLFFHTGVEERRVIKHK